MQKRIIIPQKLLVKKFNPKKAWKSINNLLGKQTRHPEVNELILEENILNNPEDISEGFNNYFSNIGHNLASQIDTSNCNFETYVKKLHQSLLHCNLQL